jgi:hypothetical protein
MKMTDFADPCFPRLFVLSACDADTAAMSSPSIPNAPA